MAGIHVREYFYRVLSTLYKYASELAVLEYPRSIEKRSLDMALKLSDGTVILVKVIEDLDMLSKREAGELALIASTLGVPAIIVADKKGGVDLVDGVVFEKHGVRVVTLRTLEDYLSGSEKPFIYQSKDMFKVRIDPGKMRERRLEMGLSLGDLALFLGTSRRAVYEYERGGIEPTVEKGEKLVEMLGEDILKPIELTEPLKAPKRSLDYDTELERSIAERLTDMGYRVYHAKRTVSDIGGSRRGEARIMIAVRHRRESDTRMVEKASYLERLCSVTEAEAIVVVDDTRMAKKMEGEGLRAYTLNDFIEAVKQRERGKR
ncbi:MAG: helix-turn-helix domain-containing protein [Desulfurococcales archaeon]|nr:helix-turn-helix domain-containing protein [Desulfurococcales archaeon]